MNPKIEYVIQYKEIKSGWFDLYGYTTEEDALDQLKDIVGYTFEEWYEGYPMTCRNTRIIKRYSFDCETIDLKNIKFRKSYEK